MRRVRDERRQHRRHELRCPAVVRGEDGEPLAETATVNISDGGAFVTVPISSVPQRGCSVQLDLRIPRQTTNTYMLEDVTRQATVVRHTALKDDGHAGVAMEFERGDPLDIEI